jgi:hypothetical protein
MHLQGHCGEDIFLKLNTYSFEMGLRKMGRCDRQWEIHVVT